MVNGESTSIPSESSSCSSNNTNDQGGFECNICFELAQDPIITLCGHLFCWPCLYRWLHHHSHSQEWPVCKALVQEDKLVPLYGRGKNQTDPRSKSYPGMQIPSRPTGQRPETAPPPPPRHEPNSFFGAGIGSMGGFMPMASTSIGNFTMGIGGLWPSLFNFQFHGFPDATFFGSTMGHPFGGFHNDFHGGHAHGFPSRNNPMANGGHQADAALKNLFIIIGVCVLIALLSW
ncbi:PREDICTED: E3 ubiquitin-protein ligase RNF185-like isoform X2 [Tarenaya hassleriana]|uniref:E3 ubiquitin-protein ligase RNF185-like isoform X2 n=1 Tax=Tarenaya hassleriana TaxID=28532 RepID=UPI00053C9A8A|nr:PREDICTED: E3 ubiquitin-protein ligase RNF185-like isoform X2 [Tarenaya hassleriana]